MPNKNEQKQSYEQVELFPAFIVPESDNTRKDLLFKLKNADFVCEPCGIAFSTPSTTPSFIYATMHHGCCDVCGDMTTLTSVRTHGYLQHGITAVEKALSQGNDVRRLSTSLVGKFIDLCDRKGV
jgi:hypothetical protein